MTTECVGNGDNDTNDLTAHKKPSQKKTRKLLFEYYQLYDPNPET
eukprot:CAMPEP_0171042332 /NCGR_PEP_ID=MMETSP0736-20130129/46241_1 /TAXON_ID=186038 /ORGANISM="Fragilariopsis kerguelensis, Strain L26-C5" /LENGTH=44 /DNA_ID= /DNA_START= /DNA_END= /DNA_ORIENTATION=